MSHTNIIELLDEQAAASPWRCALIHEQRQYNLAWVSRAVAWLASTLADHGLGPGSIVGLRILHRRDLLLSQLAIARLGATLLNLSPFDSSDQHQDLIARAGACWVLTDDSWPAGDAGEARPGPVQTILLPPIPEASAGSLPPLDHASPPAASLESPWVLLVGSGSTGGVRILPLNHRAALARGEAYARAYAHRVTDRLACLTPLELGFGGIRTAMTLCAGGCVVLLDPRERITPDTLRSLGVTILLGGTSHAERLLQEAADVATPCLDFLRILLLGGSSVTDDLRRRIAQRLTGNLYVNYGCQECGPLTMSRPTEIGGKGGVGRPIAGIDLRIVNAEGEPLPPGEPGRIQARSAGMIDGYLEDPEATARAFADGWFTPGDIGQIGPDGELIHLGRADHMMIFDGVNIHPGEVEDVMSTFPGLADVACIPMPSAIAQDIPLCVVSVLPDQSVSLGALQRFAFERLGARRPRRFIVLPAIPRTPTGKLKRAELMAQLLAHQPPEHAAAQGPLAVAVEAWQQGPGVELPDLGVHHLFEQQVDRAPDALALIDREQELSYAVLNARADQLAHRLIACGVGPEVIVAVCLERSIALIVSLLAILKAGGAYLPLDPSWPAARRAQVLREVDCTIVMESGGPSIRSDRPRPSPAFTPPGPGAALAYVTTTSGSTGRPKAVAIPHAAILRLVHPVNGFRLSAGARVLQLAPVAFDAATFEIWGPLLNGGTLVVAPPGQLSLEQLADLLRHNRITTLWLTAGLFHAMVDAQLESLAGVRQVLAGGDVLSPDPVQRLLTAFPPGHELINGYGPTEATTFTCCHHLAAGETVDPAGVPIGRPIAETTVRVLDASGRPSPIGVPGELHIGGSGLARGYLNNHALTAEQFIPDPFCTDPAARLYRSGDLASWNPDGSLAFHGRLDQQIKLRGFRIEPGEIEAHLLTHPAVARAVVVLHRDAPDHPRLIAHWVLRDPERISDPLYDSQMADQLRVHLAARLPEPMLPSIFHAMEALPLTPNGKLDRRALPVPCLAGQRQERVAPRSHREQRLHAIWTEILGHSDFGITDNFFTIGGHSLAAARLTQLISAAGCPRITMADIFRAPTVAELSELLSGQQDRNPSQCLVTLQPNGAAIPLFVIHGGVGDVAVFLDLARALAPDRPVHGLQAIGLDGRLPRQTSVEQMAARYAAEIRAAHPNGPYHLLGYSAGGWYAHAVAAELLRLGGSIGLLAVIDTAATADLHRRVRIPMLALHLLQRFPLRLREFFAGRPHRTTRFLRLRLRALRFHLSGLRRKRPIAAPEELAQRHVNPTQILHSDYFVMVHTLYRPPRLPLCVDVLATRSTRLRKEWVWRFYARRGVRWHPALDRHEDFFNASRMPALADLLRRRLAEIENR